MIKQSEMLMGSGYVKQMPISRKIMLIIIMTTMIVQFLTVTALFMHQYVRAKDQMQRLAVGHAEVLELNVIAQLSFMMNDEAQEWLKSLEAVPGIINATVFDENNRLFASFGQELIEYPDIVKESLGSNSRFHGDYFEIVEPIIDQTDNSRMGMMYMKVSLEELHQNLRSYLIIVGISILLAFVVAILISAKLQRIISDPIREMTGVARHIKDDKDYSIRSKSSSNDEIGMLSDAFNGMLDQIEERGKNLEQARKRAEEVSLELQELNKTLEIRIKDRTKELADANADLQKEMKERSKIADALRESEQRFRGLIETTHIGVIITSDKGIVEWINDSFCRLFDYTRVILSGKKIITLVAEKKRMSFEEVQATLSDGIKTSSLGRYEMFRSDGENLIADVTGTSFVGSDGKMKIAWFMVDATASQKAEASLRATLQKEKAVSEMKDRFVSMVSHDLRTPINVINFAADMLKAEGEDLSRKEHNEFVHDIKRSCDNIKDLMEDVLFIGKMNAGKFEVNKQECNIADFLKEQVRDIEIAYPKKARIHLKLKDMGQPGFIDRKLLRQILQNLLSNAVKYSPDVSLVICEAYKVDDSLVVKIADKGIGIPEKDQNNLFEPFHRAKNSTAFTGTGLGLTIVKKSLDLLGGEIKCKSEVGEGTTFTLIIQVFSQSTLVNR